ncbi:MAG: T9SS type A sorting domain-containing protein [Cyclobacteriaceae bacterium]
MEAAYQSLSKYLFKRSKTAVSSLARRLFLLIAILLFLSEASAQPTLRELFPHMRFLGASNPRSRNVNHPEGSQYQHLKRATGLLGARAPGGGTEICSCTIMNSTRQDGKILLSTAAHCLVDRDVGEVLDDFLLSFDYEHPNALARGGEGADDYITRVDIVSGTILLLDYTSDIALIEVEEDDEWHENIYASGWKVSDAQHPWANISHPKADHKKVFINPKSTIWQKGRSTRATGQIVDGNFYNVVGGWTNRLAYLESTSSGSGYYNPAGNLIGVHSSSSRDHYANSASALSNNWYSDDQSPSLQAYLDPDGNWLSSVPGGYLSDLVPLDQTLNFELEIGGGKEVSTRLPDVSSSDPLAHVVHINPLTIYDDLGRKPLLEQILGLKLKDPGDGKVFLTVHGLVLDENDGEYKERFLYGVHANQVNPESPAGFEATGWTCQNAPDGYPPCGDGSWWDVLAPPLSNDFKRSYIKTYGEKAKSKNTITTIGRLLIPVVIRLKNTGTAPATVQAVSYPGDVPQNALQLFEPDEVAQAFKSYKYPDSQVLSSDDLYIDQINLHHVPIFPNVRNTGNNGGYVNLVNPNFEIELHTDNQATLDLTVHNPNNITYTYSVWIDYFNSEALNGKNEEDHTYNYVDDPVPHPKELVAQGSSSSGSASLPIDVLSYRDLKMAPGETRSTRMRISISDANDPPKPAGPIFEGETEDYLIEIVTPTCEQVRPSDYAEYAEEVIPYCGRDGYREGLESLSDHYQEETPGSLIFKIGKQSNVRFASAKATSSWYTSGLDALTDNRVTPVPNPAATDFDQSLMAISTNAQESDPGQLVDQELRMDVYYPLPKDGVDLDELAALPVIIYHFGGAFMWNTRQSELTQKTCEWLASRGYIVAAIDYRVGLYGYESEVAKRTMIRAWQDSRAATKWWRMAQNESKVTDQFQVLWKADQSSVYALGHSAGGITSQTNLFLTEFGYEIEGTTGKFLEACSGGYGYGGLDGDGNYNFSTFDLSAYEPIPCLEINGMNTCDVLSKSTDDTYGTYQEGDTQLTELIAQLLQEYSSVDGRVDKAVSFAGALAKTNWMLTPSYRPSAEIHHKDDAVVPWGHDYPFNGGSLPWGSIVDMFPNFSLSRMYGGGSMKEAWDNAPIAPNGTFELLTLEGEDMGGMSGQASYHVPEYEFGSNYDDYLAGGDPEIEDKIMYYVDAFFTKDWTSTTATARLASSEEEVEEEPIKEEPVFKIFPNPASDEVNVIVEVPEAGPFDLQIIDLQGRAVYQMQRDQVREGTQWIKLSNLNLPSGMYVLQLIANGIERGERLIIK